MHVPMVNPVRERWCRPSQSKGSGRQMGLVGFDIQHLFMALCRYLSNQKVFYEQVAPDESTKPLDFEINRLSIWAVALDKGVECRR